jgi:hypothetical protein
MSFFSFQDVVACTTGIMVLITLLMALELIDRQEARSAPASEAAAATDITALQATVAELQRERDELKRQIEDGRAALEMLASGAVITPEQLKALEEKLRALERGVAEMAADIKRATPRRDQAVAEIQQLEQAVARQQKERDRIAAALRGPPRLASGKSALYVECAAGSIVVGQFTPDAGLARLKQFDGATALQDFLAWAASRSREKEYFGLLVRPQGVDFFLPIVSNLEGRGFELGWGVCLPDMKLFAGK